MFPPPRFERLPEKKMIGLKRNMSIHKDATSELWRNFMPRRNEIEHPAGSELFCIKNYPSNYFQQFDPAATFEKWAAREVFDFTPVPEGMECLVIPEGYYAVFHYTGSSQDHSIFTFIFRDWLPGSGYILDPRPHFDILTDQFRPSDPQSKEDLWIPVHVADEQNHDRV